MKMFLIISFIVVSFMINSNKVHAENSPSVEINNNIVLFDKSPVIQEGIMLVQMRPIFEKLGLKVSWEGETNTIIGERDNLIIKMQINNKNAQVNNNELELSLAPALIDGYTFVPVRFISEATGAKVIWNDNTKQVLVYSINELLLYFHIENHNLQEIKDLLNTPINLNFVDDNGISLLEKAIIEQEEDIAVELIRRGAIVNIKNSKGYPLIYSAIELGQFNTTNELINAGAEITEKSTDGSSPLSFSRKLSDSEPLNKHFSAVAKLLENEAEVTYISDVRNPTKIENNNLSLTINSIVNGETGLLLNIDLQNTSEKRLFLKQFTNQFEIIVNNQKYNLLKIIPFRNQKIMGITSYHPPIAYLPDGNGVIEPQYKGNFDLLFQPIQTQEGNIATIKVTLRMSSQIDSTITNNLFAFRIKLGEKVNDLLTKDEIEKYLNTEYANLQTTMGTFQVICFVDPAIRAGSEFDAEDSFDYKIAVRYEEQMTNLIKQNNLTTEQRENLMQELISFQEQLAKDLILRMPTKKLKGYFDDRVWKTWYAVSSNGTIYYKHYLWTNYDYPKIPNYGNAEEFQEKFLKYSMTLYSASPVSFFRWVELGERNEDSNYQIPVY